MTGVDCDFRRRGAVLVVCLAAILLLSVVMLTFFSRSQFNRKIEASGAARTRAEILARSGVEYAVSGLIREIVDPANSEEVNGVYKPRTPEKMRPAVQLKPAARTLRMMHVPALLKQSITEFDPVASKVNSASPDRAGRFVGPARWNAPTFHYSNPQFRLAAQAPDWICFSADGPTRNAPVVGRVAFNIYEIDGLLDLSVGGYPSQLNGRVPEIDSLKATVAGADVSKISRYFPFDQSLVDIRSRGSARSGAFVEAVLENTNGFLDPQPGDTHFFSRLDLIRYALTNQFNNNTMAFVTAWSRSLDAPSWDPDTPTAANLFAPAIRRTSDVTITNYFPGGATRIQEWKQGDAVASRRFALNRLRWFDEPEGGNRTRALRQYFGLEEAPGGAWRYVEDRIRTLEDLRSEDREPNFFEMLKAAIVSGSLGGSGQGGLANLTVERDSDQDLHVLRIGASIIDAATSDDEPTILSITNGGTARFAYGIKDLPYLHGVRFRQIIKTDEDGAIEHIDQFALPILVNPHPDAARSRPKVRLKLLGWVENPRALTGGGPDLLLRSRYRIESTEDDPSEGVRIISVDPDAFETLSPITGATSPEDPNMPPGEPRPMPGHFEGSFLGFWLASGEGSGTADNNAWSGDAEVLGFNLALEYWNGTEWVVYDALIGDGRQDPATGWGGRVAVSFSSTQGANPDADDADFTGAGTLYLAKSDPRTTRGGPLRGQTDSKPDEFPGSADEETGDLKIAKVTVSDVLADGASKARRALPHRPFHTVGELGGAFRDEAWRTVDFVAKGSADAALLDYFSITESGLDAVVSGGLGLNSGRGDGLDAQLSGTVLADGKSQIVDEGRITEIVDQVLSSVLRSPADLVGRVTPSNREDTKEKREAYVRALGTAGQTRTWNFFIDLIAQAGRSAPPGSSNPEDFFAQGECRLWMHVAIDRFTGRVIASHVEAYQEAYQQE